LAFYGRTSTAEFPDPATSRAWQREMAEAVIADRGVIVVDFLDLGCSQRAFVDTMTAVAGRVGRVEVGYCSAVSDSPRTGEQPDRLGGRLIRSDAAGTGGGMQTAG
jgi:hypothetical protein